MGLSKIKEFIVGNLLIVLTITGVLLGLALGFGLREAKDEWSDRNAMYVKFVGDIFLRMLKGLILPLIVSSMITAVGSMDMTLSKKIGFRAIVYYISTTVLAVILGIALVVIIKPGEGRDSDTEIEEDPENVTTADTLMDLLRNAFPENIVDAAIHGYQTVLVHNKSIPDDEQPHKNDWEFRSKQTNATNILGLIVFSIVFGVSLSKMREKGKPVLDFFTCLSEAMMQITRWVIWLCPVGICFLIAGQILDEDDLAGTFSSLGLYFGTVMAGIFIHGFIVLPLIYFIATRELPFKFMLNLTQCIVTAWGTSSSSATLPITFRCLEELNGVDERVSRFVLPIGATINMDGTALYEAVAAIFIAQLHGMDLTFGNIIAISITATAASIGAAGIPQGGLVTMVMVLNTVGLPAHYISYIIAVDWLLDRFRTAINVLGDSFGAGIVYKLSMKDLEDLDKNKNVGGIIYENSIINNREELEKVHEDNLSHKP